MCACQCWLHAYLCADAVEVVSELYIKIVINFFVLAYKPKDMLFFHIYIQQLVLLIYYSVINHKNVSIPSSDWPHNFRQLSCSINDLKNTQSTLI